MTNPSAFAARPTPRLLATKLHTPQVKATVVRPHLIARLNQAFDHRLVLIAAPAGFGKTTLAATWLAHLPEPSVHASWLSLDESDNELRRFLAYLIAALQKFNGHIGRGLVDALQSPELPDVDVLLTALLNDFVAAGEDESPVRQNLLIFDDYHVLENPHIDRALAFLIDHLPENLHVVILTRIDPTLPLARLRAKGAMLEIRERDLRFNIDEARVFLREQMQISITGDDIALLHARTEGWIAGLQLAGLAIRGSDSGFVANFGGTHRYILDYLSDEVFQHQPTTIQRFLLETAPLNRMCAELCDALRGSDDNQQILEALERAHLFVVPLDSQRRWYRYHHLFADLLRQRLRQTLPGAVDVLHGRASDWYAARASETGDEAAIDEAISHALAAHNLQQAAALLDRFGDMIWQRGEHDKLRQWLALLPADVITPFPALAIFQAWLAFTAGSYETAQESLRRAEAHLTDAAEHDELRGRVAAVRAFIATFTGQDTISAAQSALTLLGSQSTWRGSAAIALGDAYSLHGQITAASAAYRDALQTSRATGNIYLALNAGFKYAAIKRQQALLKEAYEICTDQIALAEKSGLAQTAMAGCLYALRGDILCEWDQIGEALAQTLQGMEASTHTQHIGFAGWIVLYRARCLLAVRDLNGAESALDSLTGRAQGRPLPAWIISPLDALRALIALARGQLAQVQAWADHNHLSLDDPHLAAREFEYLSFARLLAVQNRVADAHVLLARLVDSLREHGRAQLLLIALLLQVRLYLAQKQPEYALEALCEALTIGERGGFLRAFLELGAAAVPLLRAAESRGVTPDYTHRLLAAASAPSTIPAPTPDTLSDRERDVLRLIAAGLKNQEIADQLVISLNTVLYHTKNIYSKLQVSHRTQAVLRARELDLL